jgi:hypothetical protein
VLPRGRARGCRASVGYTWAQLALHAGPVERTCRRWPDPFAGFAAGVTLMISRADVLAETAADAFSSGFGSKVRRSPFRHCPRIFVSSQVRDRVALRKTLRSVSASPMVRTIVPRWARYRLPPGRDEEIQGAAGGGSSS